jgi:hypothetical protein
MRNNQELTVNNIQQDLQCNYAQAQAIKEQADALKQARVDDQAQQSASTSFENMTTPKSSFANQPMPILVEATIYNMQGTFSEMATKLWANLAHSAQLEIDSIEKAATAMQDRSNTKLVMLEAQLGEMQSQLSDANGRLVEQMQYIEKIENNNNELNIELKKLTINAIDIDQQVTLLKDQLTIKDDELCAIQNNAMTNEQELVKTQKIANRSDKEKIFLTSELTQLQKELIQAETIILDLYENKVIDNYTLEKAGYKKHLKAMSSQSLTNKLFKSKN